MSIILREQEAIDYIDRANTLFSDREVQTYVGPQGDVEARSSTRPNIRTLLAAEAFYLKRQMADEMQRPLVQVEITSTGLPALNPLLGDVSDFIREYRGTQERRRSGIASITKSLDSLNWDGAQENLDSLKQQISSDRDVANIAGQFSDSQRKTIEENPSAEALGFFEQGSLRYGKTRLKYIDFPLAYRSGEKLDPARCGFPLIIVGDDFKVIGGNDDAEKFVWNNWYKMPGGFADRIWETDFTELDFNYFKSLLEEMAEFGSVLHDFLNYQYKFLQDLEKANTQDYFEASRSRMDRLRSIVENTNFPDLRPEYEKAIRDRMGELLNAIVPQKEVDPPALWCDAKFKWRNPFSTGDRLELACDDCKIKKTYYNYRRVHRKTIDAGLSVVVRSDLHEGCEKYRQEMERGNKNTFKFPEIP